MKEIEVVAGVIIKDGKIFAAQRPNKGELALKWEFPGGKVEVNESYEAALKREMNEELGIEVTCDSYLMNVRHEYKTFELLMHVYVCKVDKGEITLKEHNDSGWFDLDTDLFELNWADADIPVLNKLLEEK